MLISDEVDIGSVG